MNLKSRTPVDFFAIFFLGIILFTLGLTNQEIISFESRFYIFAQNMLKDGPSFFPYSYGHPYPDYPGTSTFLIYLAANLLGGLNKLTAVLPSAIAAAGTLAMTYLIGALFDRRWGIIAVFFLLFTAAFIQEARTISLDIFITFITTTCFYLVCSANKLKKYKRLAFIPFLVVLGFFIRGPIGLIVPTGVICMFYLLEKNIKFFLITGIVSSFLLLASSGLLLLLAKLTAGPQFAHDVLNMQILSRMGDHKAPPIYFYFIENFGTFIITYPLMVIMLFGLLPSLKNKKILLHLLAWAGVILLGLSIPGDKKIRYILPIAPALALFCGYLFIAKDNPFVERLKKYFQLFCTFLPLVSFLAVAFCFIKTKWQLPYAELFIFLAAIQLVALKNNETLKLLAGVTTFLIISIFILEPINLQLNQAREFVQQVELARQVYKAKLIFYREAQDGLAIKYLINMPKTETPIFVDTPEQLINFKDSAFYIAKKENFDSLPSRFFTQFKIIASGKMGRENMIIFKKDL